MSDPIAVSSATLSNIRVRETLLNQLSSLRDSATVYMQTLREELFTRKDALVALTQLEETHQLASGRSTVFGDARTYITSAIEQIKNREAISKHRTDEATRQYEHHTRTIQETTRNLSATKLTETHLNVNYLKDELSKNPHINPDTVRLFRTEDGHEFARFVFSKIIMRPTSSNFEWITTEDGSNLPYIPLPDIVVIVNLTTADATDIKISPYTDEREYCFYSWDGHVRVHPHILGNDTPCWGSFRDSLFEALKAHDIVWLSQVLQLFLEHANNDDSAGCQWVRYFDIDHNIPPRTGRDTILSKPDGTWSIV